MHETEELTSPSPDAQITEECFRGFPVAASGFTPYVPLSHQCYLSHLHIVNRGIWQPQYSILRRGFMSGSMFVNEVSQCIRRSLPVVLVSVCVANN